MQLSKLTQRSEKMKSDRQWKTPELKVFFINCIHKKTAKLRKLLVLRKCNISFTQLLSILQLERIVAAVFNLRKNIASIFHKSFVS